MAMIERVLLLAVALWQTKAKPVSDIGPIYTSVENVVNPPEAQSGLFEGDIVLPEGSFRNALSAKFFHWPGGVVPYAFDDSIASDPEKVRMIKEAIFAMEKDLSVNGKKCITFVPRTTEEHYIDYFIGRGCFSPVGYNHNKQRVSIGYGCYSKGTIQHETLHSLGFWHEQSRYDRDRYVKVNWENIYAGQEHNFKILRTLTSDNLGTKYDYDSVMHYGKYGFSKNGKPTLTPTDPNVHIGNRNDMSPTDIFKVQTLYGCFGKEYEPPTPAPNAVLAECTFDNGWCNFMKTISNANFELVQGPRGALTGDHTSGSGSYALYSNGSTAGGQYGRLDIYEVPASPAGYCMSFWYYTNQVNPGLIRYWTRGQGVYAAEDIRVTTPLSGWTEFRKFLPMDHFANIYLDLSTNKADTIIAIDDLKFVHGSC